MELTQADKALARRFAGGLEHAEPEPALPRNYILTGILTTGETVEKEGGLYPSAYAAMMGLLSQIPGAVACSVRPEVELTEAEGYRRFPEALHDLATVDALRGWMGAKADAPLADELQKTAEPSDAARIQMDHDWAFVAQLSMPDPLEQAHRAMQGA